MKDSLIKLGEFGLIDLLKKQLGTVATKHALTGIGDDCAVFKAKSEYLLWTHDLLLENVHFLSGTQRDFVDLGYKALAVNLSDIAAMGGTPKAALVGLGIPTHARLHEIQALYRGFKKCAAQFSCGIVGGDSNRSKQGWVLAVTVLGSSRKPPLLRSGARAGDILYVTGDLGSARLGWEAIRQQDRASGSRIFRNTHARPRPRLAWGQQFLGCGAVGAMIDLSDGLAGDLNHLARASSVAFRVNVEQIPRHARFEAECRRLGQDPLEILICGGEDYELLFTVRKNRRQNFEHMLQRRNIKATAIGAAVSGQGPTFFKNGKKLSRSFHSYAHF